MKKFLIVTLLALALASTVSLSSLSHVAIAAETCDADSEFCALAPIPGLTSTDVTSVIDDENFGTFFNNLYRFLVGLAAILAVIEIVWGGLEISTKDSVSKQSDGKSRITNAIFGLILVLMPVLVFSIINPRILNLSIPIPPLNTASDIDEENGDAGNGEVPYGGVCSSDAQCSTGFCNPTDPPPTQDTIGRCTNRPDDNNNECEPNSQDPDKSCPEHYACAITSESEDKLVCTINCLTVDPAFVDCTGAALLAWCPTEEPDWNECKMTATRTIAVCVNIHPDATDPACQISVKGPMSVNQIENEYEP